MTQQQKIKVRNATARDASNIVRLLMDWHRNADLQWPEANEMDVLSWVCSVLDNGEVIVAERAGRLIGVLGLGARPLEWNREHWVLHDKFFFVSPAYRRGGAADALITRAKTLAASHQVPLVMSIISGRNTERLERYYQIKGGEYAGGVMVFGIPRHEQAAQAEEAA
jgi:GNAT superfamily N-acetyltransferase